MLWLFIKNQRKAFWRSKNTGKSIALRIVMGLFIAYMLLNIFVGGFFLDRILSKAFPKRDVIESFNRLLLYYFLVDLLMRFQLQELPALAIKPYLHLRIKKNQLINYLSFTSLFTAFNLSPFLLVVPFLSKVVLPMHGAWSYCGMMIAILCITLFNHFFTLWLKRKSTLNPTWILTFLGAVIALAAADFYFHIVSISGLSAIVFSNVFQQPFLSIVPLFMAGGIFLVNHLYLKNNLYLEQMHRRGRSYEPASDIRFLNRYGRSGDLATNELKLILRNKRPKSVMVMSVFFLFYGLIFYGNSAYEGYGWIVFCGSFMTGIFIINYGQLMFSWQSAHFDGLLVHKVAVKDFFASKFLLFTVFSTASLILTIPYVYFGWNVLMVHFVMYVWNLGVNTTLVLYFANRNYKRMDLSKGGALNWEGFGASQWILAIPLLAGPYVVYLPMQLLGYPEVGIALLGIIGLGFLLTRNFWIDKLAATFQRKRYAIAAGFRNK